MNKLLHFSLIGLVSLLLSSAWGASADHTVNKIAAIVNNDVITDSELNNQIAAVKQQLLSRQMPVPEADILRKQVLQHLIDVELQIQMAKQAGLRIDDAELDQAISQIAAQHHFSVAELKQAVTRDGLPFDTYRNNISKQLLLQKVQRDALAPSVQLSEEEVKQHLQKQLLQIKEYHVQNILIPLPDEPTSLQVQAAQAKADKLIALLKKGADFNKIAIAESSDSLALQGGDLGWRMLSDLPPLFAKKVEAAKANGLIGPVRAANGFHILKLVATRLNQPKHTLQVTHLRQILLKNDALHALEKNRAELLRLRQAIIDGADFAKLAKQYSQDTLSANQGGDLGWLRPSELPQPIAFAMEKLKTAEISEPLLSPLGVHLIQVLARKEIEDTTDFVEQQVRNQLYQQRFQAQAENWLQKLRGKAFIKTFS